jgi:drug/metabolite transporter (DMT)-like permease
LRRRRRFLVLGLLNAALPFALIAFAALTLTASLAAVLNATTPAFTAVAARVLLGGRFTPRQALGLAFGIAVVALLLRLDTFTPPRRP